MLNSFKDFYICIKRATMWYFYCQNNKSSICACSVVPMVFIYASNELSSSILSIKIKNLNLCMLNRAIMWYPDNQLRIKLNLCIVLKENKNILCKNQISIKKICINSVSINSYICLLRQEMKLLKIYQIIISCSAVNCDV